MADSKETSSTTEKTPSKNPNSNTNLTQVESDLALARALQEQERVYMMLRRNGSDYANSDGGSYEDEEEELDGDDAFDANERGIIAEDLEDDEAYARDLQDAEERDVRVRLMGLAGMNDYNGNDDEDDLDAWREIDPDELSYEDLIELGEIVGIVNRGLSMDTIASLPSICYKACIGEDREDCNSDPCVICRFDFEDGDSLVVLSCNHKYHTECINKWLQINKACPLCNTEVSTSCGSQAEAE